MVTFQLIEMSDESWWGYALQEVGMQIEPMTAAGMGRSRREALLAAAAAWVDMVEAAGDG